MNKIILMGRLTRDPELRVSQGENAFSIASFSIAVDRRFQKNGEKETDFFNCTAFGKQADFVDRYLRQGTKILLSGRVENDNYTNKNGEKVYAVKVVCEEIEFAESKNSSSSPDSSSGHNNSSAKSGNDEWMNVPDSVSDELPFN